METTGLTVVRDDSCRNRCVSCAPKDVTRTQAMLGTLFNVVIPVACIASILATTIIVDRRNVTLDNILFLTGLIVSAGISHVVFLVVVPSGGLKTFPAIYLKRSFAMDAIINSRE